MRIRANLLRTMTFYGADRECRAARYGDMAKGRRQVFAISSRPRSDELRRMFVHSATQSRVIFTRADFLTIEFDGRSHVAPISDCLHGHSPMDRSNIQRNSTPFEPTIGNRFLRRSLLARANRRAKLMLTDPQVTSAPYQPLQSKVGETSRAQPSTRSAGLTPHVQYSSEFHLHARQTTCARWRRPA